MGGPAQTGSAQGSINEDSEEEEEEEGPRSCEPFIF